MQQTGFPENESRISGGSFLKIFNCSFLGQIDFVCPPWQPFIWFQFTLVRFFLMSVFVSVFESVIVSCLFLCLYPICICIWGGRGYNRGVWMQSGWRINNAAVGLFREMRSIPRFGGFAKFDRSINCSPRDLLWFEIFSNSRNRLGVFNFIYFLTFCIIWSDLLLCQISQKQMSCQDFSWILSNPDFRKIG